MSMLNDKPNIILSDIHNPEEALLFINKLSDYQLSNFSDFSDATILECIAEISKYSLTTIRKRKYV
ncbi:hypothetical protein RBG61_06575 [Paludicola sp. MB14-C6]|uniref:hypothetical protein n=1 Tax=Paludihabitans sp. MB14-C6 TaxID=3070656 RepID=UPI0027DDDF58|nr:hypothetical protein [Paludicola sp. MB14-C6]WMJ24326.1 hypothetical protein RBG61_06575 [Paludicola sp. MB14-C6]